MPHETSDLFEVEHIEYVADRSVDEVTDGKYASEVASSTRTGVCETSKRFPRWCNQLDSRLQLSPKCRRTI
jgi:hypothetical protein